MSDAESPTPSRPAKPWKLRRSFLTAYWCWRLATWAAWAAVGYCLVMGFSDSARIEKAGGTPEEARAATYEWGRTAGYLGTRAIALWTVSLILRAKIEEHAD